MLKGKVVVNVAVEIGAKLIRVIVDKSSINVERESSNPYFNKWIKEIENDLEKKRKTFTAILNNPIEGVATVTVEEIGDDEFEVSSVYNINGKVYDEGTQRCTGEQLILKSSINVA